MKKHLLSLSRLILLLSLALCFRMPARAQDGGYTITGYDINIVIGEDNTYHVTENITADFSEMRHGIFRYIPVRQEKDWNINGEKEHRLYSTPVKNIKVTGDKYDISTESGNKVIKIGDPDKYISGEKKYTISYDYLLGDDKIKSLDFIYYNFIGNEWDCSIKNVAFSVTLPKSFDKSKIWFYSGSYGTAGNAPVKYSVSGNKISGRLMTELAPNESLTMQVSLPEGYYHYPAPFPYETVLIVLAILLLILTVVLFLLYGRDEPLVTPVEIKAPEGLTSAEAGYIIDSVTDDKDVVSLIIYWASKGLLSIEQEEKDSFRLKKLGELPNDAKNFERHMFAKLFEGRDEVNTAELKEKFYETIETTKALVTDHYSTKDNRLYSSGSVALSWLIRLLTALLLASSLFIAVYEATYYLVAALAVAGIGVAFAFLPASLLGRTVLRWQGTKSVKRGAAIAAASILFFLTFIICVASMAALGMPAAGFAVAASTAVTTVISMFMRKRTKLGSELLGRLLGFKNFLERAEKPRIEKLVLENPSYFYDVLPFAYVLGVSDKWVKKFEGIAVSPPEWYRSSYGSIDTFSLLVFQSSLYHSMSTMRSAMISRPVEQMNSHGGSFGGGFGGGGFSGGGFGGGGGGSW
ncbi:MAG: DUF2207 domain-containing protein [Bacillota bacterium]|nr:DUF2207 domain-containing protein [Bacillota bacterium]